MHCEANTWALVLAAGEGTRLRTLTTTRAGESIPKQFCSLNGGLSLFHQALQRAHGVASRTRTCAVVAKQHRVWWQGPPRALPLSNLIVQSRNRGTANGILLPLLYILERDPNADIVILPSDHYVREERVLARALDRVVEQLRWRPDDVLLIGFEPQEPDPELGYILPGRSDGQGALWIEQFVEKPSPFKARQLVEQGGLWNAFIVAAGGRSLLNLFRQRIPDQIEVMRAAVRQQLLSDDPAALEQLYNHLPMLDFSAHILTGQEAHLRVFPVSDCGWSDLGTVRRVEAVLRNSPCDAASRVESLQGSYLSLAAQYEQQRKFIGPVERI